MFYKLKKFSLVFLLFLINHSSFSNNLDTTKTMLKSDFDTIIQLNSIEKLFIKHDSMLNKNISKIYKASDTIILNSFFYSPDSIPDFSDSIYAYRIQNLNLETPIYLHYNRSVQEQIDLYALKYRQHVSKMLGIETDSGKCSIKNITINNNSSLINGNDTGNIDDEYDMGF